jgi:hypothetical protein
VSRRALVALVASVAGLLAGVALAWSLTRSPTVRVVYAPGRTITQLGPFAPTSSVSTVATPTSQADAELPAIAVPVMATVSSTPTPPDSGGGGQAPSTSTSTPSTAKTSTSLCGGALC